MTQLLLTGGSTLQGKGLYLDYLLIQTIIRYLTNAFIYSRAGGAGLLLTILNARREGLLRKGETLFGFMNVF